MVAFASLTRGESLLLKRRRLGIGQAEMARKWGVSRNTYNRWEQSSDQPIQLEKIEDIKPHEKCLILRRRRGRTQEEIADHLGISRVWVTRMESGEEDCSRLMKLWGLS